ncbi:MAG: hypothetical protein RLP44_18225 [Aggregatilineales bacterium]
MKRLLILLPLLMLCLFYQVDDASACSGGPPPVTLNEAIEYDVIVIGRILENSGGNSIIEVERYLLGSGERYLLMSRQTPALWISKNERQYGFGCNYALSEIAPVGTQLYMALNRNPDGSYDMDLSSRRNFAIIPYLMDERVGVSYRYYNGDIHDEAAYHYEKMEVVTTTPEAFEATIADLTGQIAVAPDPLNVPQNYGMDGVLFRRTLRITSENGTEYMLPIDRREVVGVSDVCQDNCPISSPDYTHFLQPISGNEHSYVLIYQRQLAFDAEFWEDTSSAGNRGSYIIGEEFLFSPDSNFFIAWAGHEIVLYEIRIEVPESEHRLAFPRAYELRRIELDANDENTAESLYGSGAWSGNSRMFAYIDAEGLKVVDILDAIAEPRLVAPNAGAGLEVELSQSGRYVRYGTKQLWRLYDLLTGTVYNNTLISPDEGYFVRFYQGTDPENESTNESQSSLFADVYSEFSIVDWHWMDDEGLYLILCRDETRQICVSRYFLHQYGYWGIPYAVSLDSGDSMRQIAYDDLYGKVAIQIDDYSIFIEYIHYLGLSDIIDSPIAHIEWGEPLWYVED